MNSTQHKADTKTAGGETNPIQDAPPSISRRQLLGAAGKTTAALAVLGTTAGAWNILPVHAEPVSRRRRVGANDKITLGLIGCGGMGTQNLKELMKEDDVNVAGLCDVDESHFANDTKMVSAKYGKDATLYRDYRKLLENKDIDAVIIGTPDHWHALNMIHAVEAGKDAYCEKPIAHDIVEAKTMAAAAKHHSKIVQVGTWQRSTPEFVSAVEYIRSGKLGKVVTARAWKTDQKNTTGHHQTTPVPAELDYDMWVGPAPFTPYVKEHMHYNWRWFFNYGDGMTGDWGVHMMDIALLAMSKDTDLVMPTEVAGMGGVLSTLEDDRQWPDTQTAIMKFANPDFIMNWQTGKRPLDQSGPSGEGTQFIASDGKTLTVWRGGWRVTDAAGEDVPRAFAAPTTNHWRNWLDCIKSREQPRSNIASMAQTTIVCHLVNAAYFAGEMIHWDKAKMDITGKAGKNTLSYTRPYRKGYTLPSYKA